MIAPVVGQRVADRYQIDGRIGAGGHGEIWSAVDIYDGQRIALKFLREDLGSSVEAWSVLNHESQMARRLNHPGILRTGTPIRHGDRTVLPMEFAGGGDLKRLRGQSYLRSVPVLIRIAEILAHAHARDVVHRDLKPGNVLFDSQGGVRLADFGASGLAGSTHLLTQGSPFYASPQQLQDLAASPADDIYGLGALAYELLTGHPPFYPDFSLERVLNGDVPSPEPTLPAPWRLLQLIQRMLDKDPANRPADMGDVIEGFNQALSDTVAADITLPTPIGEDYHRIAVPPPEPARVAEPAPLPMDAAPLPPPAVRAEPYRLPLRSDLGVTPERVRPRPTAAWSLGLLLLAAVGIGVWIHERRESARERRIAAAASAAAEERATPTVAVAEGDAATAPPAAAAPLPPPSIAESVGEPAAIAPSSDSPPAQVAEAIGEAAAAPPASPGADTEALRVKALSLEGQERWREASDTYRELLALDPNVRGVQQGLRRSSERAELSDRLDQYLASPSALRLPSARSEAQSWLSQARLLPGGPVLRSQIARIELMLAQGGEDGAGLGEPVEPPPAATVQPPSPGFSNR